MKDTFRVGDRVRVNDSCQWVSLRGEVGTITKDCGGFVFTVDFGGGCFDLKVTDFEPKHPNGCDCGGFDRNGSHSAGEYVGYCEFQDDEDDAPVTSTVATFDMVQVVRQSVNRDFIIEQPAVAPDRVATVTPATLADEIERLRLAFDGMSARYNDAEAEVKRLRSKMVALREVSSGDDVNLDKLLTDVRSIIRE